MPELDDEITRLIKGGDYKMKASAEADPYAEMEKTYKERRREPPSIAVGGKEVKLEAPPEPIVSPFDVARGRRDVAAKAAEAATEKARLEAGVEASAAERMKGIAGQARQLEAPPRFTPTPEDKATMVGMFGLLGAMAAFVGGGKQYGNALSAMNAMGGMLAGYNQGRKDLFEKDKQIYDKKVAENKAHNDHIKQLINTAMEEAKYDYAKAKANLKLKLAEVDAPVIKAQVDQKTLEELRTDVEKADLAYTNNLKAQAEVISKMQTSLTGRGTPMKVKGADGKTYYADRAGNILRNEADEPIEAADTGRATQQQFILQRAVNALGGAASAMETIVELGQGTTTGIFPYLSNKEGMLNYVKDMAGRKISSRDADMLNTALAGLGRNLATIEASGLATGLTTLAQKLESGVFINAGQDDPFRVAMKLADMKRVAIEGIKPAVTSGLLTPDQKKTAEELIDRIEKVIPYNTVEVARAAAKPGKPTLGGAAAAAVSPLKLESPEDVQAAYKSKRISRQDAERILRERFGYQ